jgi:hypothetical protein
LAQDESLQAQNEKTQNGPVGVEEYAGSEREKPEWACWRRGICRFRMRKPQNEPVNAEEYAGSE